MADPGYQFALQEGQKALERSAAARGTLRTGGTLRDLVDYGQRSAAQQYQNVYDRALGSYGVNRETALAEFDPRFSAWQTGMQDDLSRWTTKYGGNLSKWTSQYGGNLQRELQREQNIYGLLSQPPPMYGGY
jgi:hypothetical protein